MTNTSHSLLRWSFLSTFSTALMQLLASATITRFLQPSDYGLAALAMLCYSLTGYFTQMGMGRAIVQKPGLTPGNIRAAFSLSLITGVGGFLILTALSPLLGIYFHQPRLPRILVAFGLNLIFQALSMVSGGLLRREFRIRDLALCDFAGYLLSTFGIGLPMAMKGFGVWALVGSNVSQPLIVAIAYFIARPHSIMPSLEREDYRHITGFSGKASATTSIEALGASLDTIIMGKVVSATSLGLYNRSLTLSIQPGHNISMGLTRVFHPTIARAAERSMAECHQILMESEGQLLSLVFPFCAGAAIAAPTIIPVIFGPQWQSAVPVYQVLCLVAALDATYQFPALQLEVLGQFRQKFILQSAFAVLFGVGILLFAPKRGVVSVAIVYAILQAFRSMGLHRLSAKSLGVRSASLFKPWIPGLVCSGFVGAVLMSIRTAFPRLWVGNAPLRLLTLILLSAATCFAVYRVLFRHSIFQRWAGIFRSNG